MMLPILETILSEFGTRAPRAAGSAERAGSPPALAGSFHTASPRIVEVRGRSAIAERLNAAE
jgi:hypothetical protein